MDTVTTRAVERWSGKLFAPAISTGQTCDQVGNGRPPVHTPIRGLYVVGCGAGARGVGTELAASSGEEAADRVVHAGAGAAARTGCLWRKPAGWADDEHLIGPSRAAPRVRRWLRMGTIEIMIKRAGPTSVPPSVYDTRGDMHAANEDDCASADAILAEGRRPRVYASGTAFGSGAALSPPMTLAVLDPRW